MDKKPTYKELAQEIKALEKEKLNRMAAEKGIQHNSAG